MVFGKRECRKKRRLTMDHMLSKALREFASGPLNQLLVNLGGKDGDIWEEELKKFLRKQKCWKNKLFQPIGGIFLFATTSPFVASEKFTVNTGDDAPVKISCVWGNFKKQFYGKIENPREEINLHYGDLSQESQSKDVLFELGGKEKAEVLLQDVYALLKQQSKGKRGLLHIDGKANIFYVRSKKGVLCVVNVFWSSDGWYLGAGSVESSSSYHAGNRLFSPLPASETDNS
jgi:hypothetical protein